MAHMRTDLTLGPKTAAKAPAIIENKTYTGIALPSYRISITKGITQPMVVVCGANSGSWNGEERWRCKYYNVGANNDWRLSRISADARNIYSYIPCELDFLDHITTKMCERTPM